MWNIINPPFEGGAFGYEFYKLRSNNISDWLLLELFIFCAYAYETPLEKVNEVYRFYQGIRE